MGDTGNAGSISDISLDDVKFDKASQAQSFINAASEINFVVGASTAASGTLLGTNDGGTLDFTGKKLNVAITDSTARAGESKKVILVKNAIGFNATDALANAQATAVAFDKVTVLTDIERINATDLDEYAKNNSISAAAASVVAASSIAPAANIEIDPTGAYAYSATYGTQARQEQKVVLEASLAGAIAAIQSDKVAGDMLKSASGEGDIAVAALGYGSFERETGSSVKSNNFDFGAGFGRKDGGRFLGAFISAGAGSFETNNDFVSGKTIGEGDTRHFGVGVFGKFEFGASGENAAQVLARVGQVKTSFDSKDFGHGYNISGFDFSRTFYAISGEYERHFDVGGFGLSAYASLALTHVAAADAEAAGVKYDFEAVSSVVGKIGARASAEFGANWSAYADVAFEREFAGEADAINQNGGNPYSLKSQFDAPSLKGNSGVIEVGANYRVGGNGASGASAAEGFVVGVKLSGSVGKNKGIGGSVNLGYKF